MIFHLLLTALGATMVEAVTTIKACVKGGSFANCQRFNSTAHHCLTMSGLSYTSCYCNQGYFNAIVGCLNDDLKCFQNTAYAPTASSQMSAWNSFCSPLTTATTPPIYSISRTILPEACANVHSDCMDELSLLYSCSSTYFASLSLSYDPLAFYTTFPRQVNPNHCLCQPREVQLASRCTYNANVSCFGVDADTKHLDAYKSCDLAQVTPWYAPAEPTGPRAGEGNLVSVAVATERVVSTSYHTVYATETVPAATGSNGVVKSGAVREKIGLLRMLAGMVAVTLATLMIK